MPGKFFLLILALILLCAASGALLGNVPAACAITPGVITTVAGNGTVGYSGDDGPATSAELSAPASVAVDAAGNLYIADTGNNRIRKVDKSGTITTIAGNGSSGYYGDGGPATSAELYPAALAVDASGNIYIANGNRIRKVDKSGTITTIAGNGSSGYSGDGGPATSAELSYPCGVALDASGNIYIADAIDNCIRKVDVSGDITTVAGNGTMGCSGDDGPATSAELSAPAGVTVDAAGNLYIADCSNNRIRKVDKKGFVTTIAGNGARGYSGDGGPAIDSELNSPTGLVMDTSENIYIIDTGNNRIRKVDKKGFITTIAGNGLMDYSGDGGPATSADLFYPYGVAVDTAGNLFVTEKSVIREVTAIIPSSDSGQKPIIFTIGQNTCIAGGQSITMDASPWISDGRVLVPVRYLADALGAYTVWDPAMQKVTITKGSTTVVLCIGSAILTTNGTASQMDVAPVIKNGRTYLPVRYVAEVFGCTIVWNGTAQTITASQQST
jgi:sugar lactone lactonase YvrE